MPKSLTPNQFDYSGVYVSGERSSFRFRKPHLASFMSGMLVPLGDPIPVFPGVKLDLTIDAVIRSNTMIVPPLNGLFVDFFAVWVPHRIVWTHEAQFLGENDTTAWTQSNTYTYPNIALGLLTPAVRSILVSNSVQGDVVASNNLLLPHYGLATNVSLSSSMPAYNAAINVLSIRGYYACWNHLFRDENYQRPVLFDKGDNGAAGEFGYLVRDYEVDGNGGTLSNLLSTSVGTSLTAGKAGLMPVNKFHDAFTSVLPQPQFANSGVPIVVGGYVNVVAKGTTLHSMGTDGILFGNSSTATTGPRALGLAAGSGRLSYESSSGSGTYGTNATYSNLVADLSAATGSTINQLRTSIMYQRYLEALARGGRRVPEYMKVIYGVSNTNARYDYPELISRARYYLGVNQVVATADTGGSGWTSHLGDTGAFSLTVLKNIPCCERDFTEFGYLHLLYCVRSENLYSQIIQPHFLRREILDEYNPYFDHIGDVAIPAHIVNMTATSSNNFGYQEAWWDERTQLGMAVGAMNKQYGSLSYWTAGEAFAQSTNTCTPAFLCFNPATLDAFFVSRYYTYPQFIIDACIKGKKIAKMSQHSLPGIVGRI